MHWQLPGQSCSRARTQAQELHLRAARSNISTASTEVSSRRTDAPWHAEYTSGNMTKAEACRFAVSGLHWQHKMSHVQA